MCVELAGAVYDAHSTTPTSAPATNQSLYYFSLGAPNTTIAPTTAPPGDPKCYGDDCFRETFLILAGICALSVVFAGFLCARTWAGYIRNFA